jgi:hypothetical protein
MPWAGFTGWEGLGATEARLRSLEASPSLREIRRIGERLRKASRECKRWGLKRDEDNPHLSRCLDKHGVQGSESGRLTAPAVCGAGGYF